MPIYSTSTGLPYPAKNAAELFQYVISELLMQAICWDKVIQGFIDQAKCSAASEVSLCCFGNSIPLNDLNTAMKSNTPECKTSVNELQTWVSQHAGTDPTHGSTAQSKLAIVGMSCRLPGGATVRIHLS
jgi:monodictyphenone polyketide synthase